MADTKERILLAALELFAQQGFEATSMSDIASGLGVTKGALYRHYPGKEAILKAIIARMEEQDRSRAGEYCVPEDEVALDAQSYRETGVQEICAFALAQFRYWTKDAFASAFRRMLALERYRSAEMAQLYWNYISGGPLGYMEDLFREMMKAGVWKEGTPKRMALEFYGPMYLLMSTADRSDTGAEKLLAEHFENYVRRYLRKGEEL